MNKETRLVEDWGDLEEIEVLGWDELQQVEEAVYQHRARMAMWQGQQEQALRQLEEWDRLFGITG